VTGPTNGRDIREIPDAGEQIVFICTAAGIDTSADGRRRVRRFDRDPRRADAVALVED